MEKSMEYTLNTIEEILEDIKAGKPVVIMDDENRKCTVQLSFLMNRKLFPGSNFLVRQIYKDQFTFHLYAPHSTHDKTC